MIEFPKVTVVTLVYNTGQFVIEALECVKKQSYENIEHIIIDDFSIDNSFYIVNEWILQNNYKCRLIRNNQNKGIIYNLNLAISISSGKYICFISDDLWSKSKLHDQVLIFENLPSDYAMIYSDFITVNEKNEVIKQSYFHSWFESNKNIPSGKIFSQLTDNFFTWIQTSLINLNILKKHSFKFPKKIISEDWYLALFLSMRYKIYYSNLISAYYRVRPNSVTQKLWTIENKIRVYKSHFFMFVELFKDSEITKYQKRICCIQLRKYLFKIVSNHNCNFYDKVKFTFIYIIYTLDFRVYAKRLN